MLNNVSFIKFFIDVFFIFIYVDVVIFGIYDL